MISLSLSLSLDRLYQSNCRKTAISSLPGGSDGGADAVNNVDAALDVVAVAAAGAADGWNNENRLCEQLCYYKKVNKNVRSTRIVP